MSWKQFPCISWKLRTEEQRDVCLCFLQVSALREVCAAEAEGCLVKEAKKWATKAAKDYKIITHGERVTLWFLKFEDQDTHEQSFLLVTSMSMYFCEWIRSNWIGMFFSETNNKRSICVNSTLIRNVMYISAMFLHQALQTLESRLKLLSGETGLSVEQKIAEVQDSVRKAKVLFLIGLFHSGNRKIRVFTVFFSSAPRSSLKTVRSFEQLMTFHHSRHSMLLFQCMQRRFAQVKSEKRCMFICIWEVENMQEGNENI